MRHLPGVVRRAVAGSVLVLAATLPARADDAAPSPVSASCSSADLASVTQTFSAAQRSWFESYQTATARLRDGAAAAATAAGDLRTDTQHFEGVGRDPVIAACLARASGGRTTPDDLVAKLVAFESATSAYQNMLAGTAPATGKEAVTAVVRRFTDDMRSSLVSALAVRRAFARGSVDRSPAGVVTAVTAPSEASTPAPQLAATRPPPSPRHRAASAILRGIVGGDCEGVTAELAPLVARRDAVALEASAVTYQRHCDREADDARAVEQMRAAVAAGLKDPYAIGFLAKNGSPRNDARALVALRTAVARGSALAAASLGEMYASGRGVRKDPQRAHRLSVEAARLGDVGAASEVAWDEAYAFGTRADPAAAVAVLQRLVAAGNGDAAATLGRLTLEGAHEQKDPAAAVRLFELAARAHAPDGEAMLGYVLGAGVGVDRDAAAAFDWDRKAAAAGSVVGMTDLGYDYLDGLGVSTDTASALHWFRLSAAARESNAENVLGTMYQAGQGVRADAGLAAYWYRRARVDGSPLAAGNLASLLGSRGGAESYDDDLARRNAAIDRARRADENEAQRRARVQREEEANRAAAMRARQDEASAHASSAQSGSNAPYDPPAYNPPAYDPPAYDPPAYDPPRYDPPAYDPH